MLLHRTSSILFTAALLVIATASVVNSQSVLPTYNIGVLYSNSGIWAATGQRTIQIMHLWETLANSQAQALGFQVRVITADIASNASLIWPQCDYLVSRNVSFLLAPESTLSVVASQYANRPSVRIPVLSRISLSDQYRCGSGGAGTYPAYSDCRRANERAFGYAATVLQPAGVQFRDYFALVRNKGAQTAAIVYVGDNFHTETSLTGAYYAGLNKIKVVSTQVIPTVGVTNDTISSIIANLIALDPDVVTWARRLGCHDDIAMMKAMNYLPRSLIMIQCTDTPALIQANGGADMAYVNGVLFWSPRVDGPTYTDDDTTPYASHFRATPTQSSPQVFQNWFVNATGGPPSFTDASTLAVGYLIETALSTASNPLDTTNLNQALARININSFWGTLAMDQVGMGSSNAVIVTQVGPDGVLQLLSPTTAATSSFIYPMPLWSERAYVPGYAKSSGARITIALMAVCVAIYLGSLACLVYHRHDPLVKSLNIMLIAISFLGAIVTSLGVLLWLDDNNDTTCAARIPVLVIGLTMILVPMITQTWLLHRIFQNTTNLVVRMSRSAQVVRLLSMTVPLWLVMVILCARFPLRAHQLDFDPLRPIGSMRICSVDPADYSGAIATGMVLLAEVIIILGAWLTLVVRNRNVDHELFAESKRIGLTVSLLVFMLGLVLAVEFGMTNGDHNSLDVKQVIRGVGLLLSVLMAFIVLYGARIIAVMRGPKGGIVSLENRTVMRSTDGTPNTTSFLRPGKTLTNMKQQQHQETAVLETIDPPSHNPPSNTSGTEGTRASPAARYAPQPVTKRNNMLSVPRSGEHEPTSPATPSAIDEEAVPGTPQDD